MVEEVIKAVAFAAQSEAVVFLSYFADCPDPRQFLEMPAIEGAIITIDATGCQRDIA